MTSQNTALISPKETTVFRNARGPGEPQNSFLDAIRTRRAVRSFDSAPLSQSIVQQLRDYAQSEAENAPFRSSINLHLDERHLTGNSNCGDTCFFYGSVRKDDVVALIDYGFVIESINLRCVRLGLGTTYAAGIKPDKLKLVCEAHETVPCCVVPGVPADSVSLGRSCLFSVLNSFSSASKRRPLQQTFFQTDFARALNVGELSEPLRNACLAVQWAPSGFNSQEWRVLRDADERRYHFFAVGTSDFYKFVHAGIAAAHWTLVLNEEHVPGAWSRDESLLKELPPSLRAPQHTSYIGTWTPLQQQAAAGVAA